MGNWQMEVGRMILYISFPVGIYHYFNQVENVEEMLISQRKKYCPPVSKTEHHKFMEYIEEFNKENQLKRLKEMEEQYHEATKKEIVPL